MKFSLEFKLQKNTLPIEYRKVFMHFLKTCLDNANDGKYYDSFYGDSKPKKFGFAIFFDAPVFKPTHIELGSNRVKMIFSIADKMAGYIFYASFLEKKNKKILLVEDNSMMLEGVTKIAEPEIHNNKMLIKMSSPLLVRRHDRLTNHDQYYYYKDEEFANEVENNLRYQLQEEGFSEKLIKGIKIQPIKCRKVVVQHYGCKFAGTLGDFLVEGNSVILNYLLQAGLSSRHSEGFGLAELLTEEL